MAHLGVQQIVSDGHIKKFQLCGICVVDILVKELWISLCELVPVCFEVVPDDGVAIVYKRRLFDNFHGHACHVHAKEVGLLLFGTIAAVGVNTLVKNKVDMGNTRNLVIASLILTLGIGGAELTCGSITIGGIGLAALVGVILNLIIPRGKSAE